MTKPPKRNDKYSLAPPVDYSFQGILSVGSLVGTYPKAGIRPYKKDEDGKYITSVLKLSHNKLSSIDGLSSSLTMIISQPENLAWLDLSCNQLVCLKPWGDLESLVSLKLLYLHGNRLMDWNDLLEPLIHLPKLLSLTTHGNPVERNKGYRNNLIAKLPKIRSLDFIQVTESERYAAVKWAQENKNHALKNDAKNTPQTQCLKF